MKPYLRTSEYEIVIVHQALSMAITLHSSVQHLGYLEESRLEIKSMEYLATTYRVGSKLLVCIPIQPSRYMVLNHLIEEHAHWPP